MRIVTGGIAQETNTFQRELTTLADFQRPGFGVISRGWEISEFDGTGTVYGGVISSAKELGVELVPTTYGGVNPGGRVSREAFDLLRDEIVAGRDKIATRKLPIRQSTGQPQLRSPGRWPPTG